MHRIDGAGHVDNMFVAEDAEASRPPTEITPDWMNAVQEELCAVVIASGQVPSKSILNQLLLALRLEGVFSTPAADDKSTKAATTAWLYSAMATVMTFFGFSCSLGTNGFIKAPSILGGVIFQWGLYSTTSTQPGTFSFPVAFTSVCYQIVSSDSGSTCFATGASPASPSTFTSYSRNYEGAYIGGTLRFHAIGK